MFVVPESLVSFNDVKAYFSILYIIIKYIRAYYKYTHYTEKCSSKKYF